MPRSRHRPQPGGYRFFRFLPPRERADFTPRSFAPFLPGEPPGKEPGRGAIAFHQPPQSTSLKLWTTVLNIPS